MPRIKVVTDSSCDIPDALARQVGITVVTLGVSEPPPPQEPSQLPGLLAQRARWGQARLEVSAPSIEDFKRVYQSLRDGCDGILSIHASGRWTDTVANALVAREAFGPIGKGGPFPIMVLDSGTFTMGLGWIVLSLAREAAKEHVDLAGLARLAARLGEHTHVAFFVEHLDYLASQGIGARLSSQVEGLNASRPLLHLEEGQIAVYERTRTRAKARDALYNFVEDFPKIGELAIFHTGAQNDVEHLLTRVGAIYPRERVLILQPGPTVTAWLGPEAVGIAAVEGDL